MFKVTSIYLATDSSRSARLTEPSPPPVHLDDPTYGLGMTQIWHHAVGRVTLVTILASCRTSKQLACYSLAIVPGLALHHLRPNPLSSRPVRGPGNDVTHAILRFQQSLERNIHNTVSSSFSFTLAKRRPLSTVGVFDCRRSWHGVPPRII